MKTDILVVTSINIVIRTLMHRHISRFDVIRINIWQKNTKADFKSHIILLCTPKKKSKHEKLNRTWKLTFPNVLCQYTKELHIKLCNTTINICI